MKSELLKRAEILAEAGQFQDALMLLDDEIEKNQDDWYPRYLSGLCAQCTGKPANALYHLREAVRLNDQENPPLRHALAVAYQAQAKYPEALDALRHALKTDPDHFPSMITLAMTQGLMGETEKASTNYDIALRKLARVVANELPNSPDNPIYKHEPWENQHNVWAKYAMEGAVFLANRDGVEGVSWPDGDQVDVEEAIEEHKGLLWTDSTNEEGKSVRMHWPNYFTTFRESFTRNAVYAEIISNRSGVLRLLGKTEEAERHLAEAQFLAAMGDG